MTHRSALVQGISEIKSEIAGSSEDLILKVEVLINSKKESRENFQERKRGILGYRRGIGGIKREEGIFPTQGLNQSLLCFLHFRWALYCSGTWKVLESGHWEPRERETGWWQRLSLRQGSEGRETPGFGSLFIFL